DMAREPIEAAHDGKRDISPPVARVATQEERSGWFGRAPKKRRSLPSRRLNAVPLEKLAGGAKREVSIQIGPPRPEHKPSLSLRHDAAGVQECRLPHTAPAFDDQHSPMAGERSDRC